MVDCSQTHACHVVTKMVQPAFTKTFRSIHIYLFSSVRSAVSSLLHGRPILNTMSSKKGLPVAAGVVGNAISVLELL